MSTTNFIIQVDFKTGLLNLKSNRLNAKIRESRTLITNVLGLLLIATRCHKFVSKLSVTIRLTNKITAYFGD